MQHPASSCQAALDPLVAAAFELTPIQTVEGVVFKRDDLFRPFADCPFNGGKLRQAVLICSKCHRGGVVTFASVNSPQGPILAAAARHFGLRCIIIYGGHLERSRISQARTLGAEIVRAPIGRHTYLRSLARRMAIERQYRAVDFGLVEQPLDRSFFQTLSTQVRNVPKSVTRIILTCGSGITAIYVVYGILKFAPWVRELVLISTGYHKRDHIFKSVRILAGAGIDASLESLVGYVSLSEVTNFRYDTGYPTMHGAIALHPLYEGKTFGWAFSAGLLNGSALFWITGGPDGSDCMTP